MLTKTQILTAIQKSLIKYNELAVSQINSKISAHNQPASPSADGHMSKDDKTKLNSMTAGAEPNQNAISKIQIDSNVVSASGKESTAVFKANNGVSIAFDTDNAIVVSGTNASTSAAGVVQLTDSTSSTSTNTAATPNSVKKAYDKAASVSSDLSSYKTTVSNNYMSKSGGTFTGEVILKADPTKDLGAATKKYVDNKANNYMPKSGGTFTGAITLSGAPTSDLHAATKKYVDGAVANLINSAPETLATLDALAYALGDDPNFATTVANQIGTKVDKVEGKGLSTNDYTTAEKNKLNKIPSTAEENQNAFATIAIKTGTDTTNIVADTKQDTVTLIQGSNITLTSNASNDTITISAKDTTYKTATASANGLMSKGDKSKLDSIIAETDATDDEITAMIANVQSAING